MDQSLGRQSLRQTISIDRNSCFMRILLITQAVVAVLLCFSILLQNRGSGLGGAFGGDFGGYYTKRGFERFLVYAAVGLATVFFVLSIINVHFSLQDL